MTTITQAYVPPTHNERFVDEHVTNVSVEWMLKNITISIDLGHQCTECGGEYGSCPHNAPAGINWENFIQHKVGSGPDFGSYFNAIVDTMLEEGEAWHPICLVWTGDKWMMGNGHHRLALAILLGFDSVPAVFSFDIEEYMMSWVTDSDDGPYCEPGEECDC
jgi:hypothetical protein